jgi:hypothetical protein
MYHSTTVEILEIIIRRAPSLVPNFCKKIKKYPRSQLFNTTRIFDGQRTSNDMPLSGGWECFNSWTTEDNADTYPVFPPQQLGYRIISKLLTRQL